MTMNDTWGFKRNDHNWKSSKMLIRQLVDIASKGGNFLLNVGPTADGEIPPPSIDRLQEIGNWLRINGEAIYGTKMWHTYKEGPHEYDANYYEDEVKEIPFTAEDFRFTTKGNALYAACLALPESTVTIKSINPEAIPEMKIQEVTMLGSDEKLDWQYNEHGLTIEPPQEKPCDYVYVFKIVLKN